MKPRCPTTRGEVKPRVRACHRALGVALLCGALAGGAVRAQAPGECKLGELAQLPVTMFGMSPTVRAKINGVDALFIPDSGALSNTLSPAVATKFRLRLEPTLAAIQGVGGASRAYITHVDTFTIFGVDFHQVAFVVAGNDLPAGAAGLIGQNLLHVGDVEYDLANGVIRLMRPQHCKGRSLAYWAAAADKPYAVIDIEPTTRNAPHTAGHAYLNGRKIRVLLDTGAAASLLTFETARAAGITPVSSGVEAGALWSGLGGTMVRTWVGPFASFKIGEEEIRNTRLRFGETALIEGADMLLGVDFFLSHRIYVATSQNKLYFTYNGGPVFDLGEATRAPSLAPLPGATAAAAPAAATPEDARLDEPRDAEGFARRGAASAARHDYARAIGDFDRACELAPTEAAYFYQRAIAHWNNHELPAARADLDEALRLRPQAPTAHLARAQLSATELRPAATLAADLEAADQALASAAEERVALGDLYLYTGDFPAALRQYSTWLDNHGPREVRRAFVLGARCWARVQWNRELDQALQDCDAALHEQPGTARYLGNRGYVYLRQGNWRRAIEDFEAALAVQPNWSWALYGRGLARRRLGDAAGGDADLTAAARRNRNIADEATRLGLKP